ncbi:hypothetical protein P7C70_g8296, partial [Phenoliferia sp. Uapishka_3]
MTKLPSLGALGLLDLGRPAPVPRGDDYTFPPPQFRTQSQPQHPRSNQSPAFSPRVNFDVPTRLHTSPACLSLERRDPRLPPVQVSWEQIAEFLGGLDNTAVLAEGDPLRMIARALNDPQNYPLPESLASRKAVARLFGGVPPPSTTEAAERRNSSRDSRGDAQGMSPDFATGDRRPSFVVENPDATSYRPIRPASAVEVPQSPSYPTQSPNLNHLHHHHHHQHQHQTQSSPSSFASIEIRNSPNSSPPLQTSGNSSLAAVSNSPRTSSTRDRDSIRSTREVNRRKMVGGVEIGDRVRRNVERELGEGGEEGAAGSQNGGRMEVES